jgi:hypothetical protein
MRGTVVVASGREWGGGSGGHWRWPDFGELNTHIGALPHTTTTQNIALKNVHSGSERAG